MSAEDEMKKIEDEIHKTKYNKATQGHIGKLKAKLARLGEEAEGKSGKKGTGFSVKKTGDATAILVGYPSVGKSTLLNKLTNADSKIGEYDFTTLNIIPGVMELNGAKVQLLDAPGVISEAAAGKGRGREIMSVFRNADLILIIIAPNRKETVEQQLDSIQTELYRSGFRLNQKPPDIRITKKGTGGLEITSTVKLTKMSREEIMSVLNEFGIYNAEVLIREDAPIDKLIDSLMKNRVYIPSLTVMNKADIIGRAEKKADVIYISALKRTNMEQLRAAIWGKLGLIRVYLKQIGKDPDMKQPLILKGPATIKSVCLKIHQAFAKDFKFARIWGSGKFPGQKVGMDYIVKDKDVVELHA